MNYYYMYPCIVIALGVMWSLLGQIMPFYDGEGKVERISAKDTVHILHQVPCTEEASEHRLANRTRNYSRDKPFKTRQRFSCFDASFCFRSVIDEAVPQSLLADLLSIGDSGDVTAAAQQLQSLILDKFSALGIEGLEMHTLRLQDDVETKAAFSDLHSDYLSREMYLYSAIVYIDQFGMHFGGGELSIADAFESGDEAVLSEGLIVEPRLGRLVLFSAGAENMHSPMPVTRLSAEKEPRRRVLQLWFTCKDAREKCESTQSGDAFDVVCSAVFPGEPGYETSDPNGNILGI